ncbi:MAG: TIGR02099 family protein [Gammaproteobacteria bacterium]|nr:TIGR02099 family protein [Gammaproteobacteria bacterium]
MRLDRLLRLAALASAALLVAAAILVTAARVLLPRLDDHPEAISLWASRIAGVPLTIEKVSASWRGALPRIELSGIDIHYAEDATPVRLEHAGIQIRPLASLLRLQPVPATLLLEGIRLTVERLEDGRLHVTGAALEETDRDGAGAAFARWLLARDDVRIQAARITWIDRQRGATPLLLRDADLRLRNEGGRHAVRIYLRPASAPGAEAQLLAKIEGDPLSEQWHGWMRLTGASLPLAEIARSLGLEDVRAAGAVTLAIDSFWRAGALQQAHGKVSGQELQFGTLNLTTAQGTLALARDDSGRTSIALRDLTWYRDGQRLPPAAIDLAWQQDGPSLRHLLGKIDLLPLRELSEMLEPARLPPNARTLLAGGSAGGEIRDLEFGYFPAAAGAADYYVSGRFHDLALPGDGARFPRVSGLAGTFTLRRDGGELQLRSAAARLHASGALLADMPLTGIDAAVRWRRDADTWVIMLPLLHVAAAGLPVTGEGMLRLGDGAPHLDLRATLGAGDLSVLPRLLPTRLLSERTEHWIRRALASGRITAGNIIWRGPVARQALDDPAAHVEARLAAADLTLDFSPRWPPLERSAVEVAIEGRRLAASISTGRLLGGEIRQAAIEIADLLAAERLLTIQGQAQGTAAAALNIIRASPLRDGALARLEELEPAGTVGLDLTLAIPLHPGSRSELHGTAHLSDIRLRVPSSRIALAALHGAIAFTRDEWHGEQLAASYDGLPVSLSGRSERDDPKFSMRVTMRGTGDGDFLRSQLARHLDPVYRRLARTDRLGALHGETTWQARLLVPRRNATGPLGPTEVQIESDLAGLAIDLPHPLAKDAAISRPLSLRIRLPGSDGPRHVQVRYGSDVWAEFEARDGDPPDGGLRRAAILLGPGEAPFPDRPAVLIRGRTERLSLDDWWALLSGNGTATTTATGRLPVDLDLVAGEATLIGQRFGNLHLEGGGTAGGWQIEVASPDLSGRFAMTGDPGVLSAALRHLRVVPRELRQRSAIDPRRLPEFAVTCDDFRFGDIKLGAAKFSAHPDANGLVVDSLQLQAAVFAASASGRWSFDEHGHRSEVSVTLTGDDLSGLLGAFGYQTGAIEGGATRFELAATWRGSPAQFALAELDGALRLAVDRGRLLDLEPGGGRLFGLLSINNLGRRLLLDFGDLFGKGYSFNAMSGSFRLESGHAYTSDFTVLGPSARIDIAGRIGLVASDYDQRITVTPEVSGTLPLAGALFGPAGIGVGAAVYLGEKIFRSIPETFDSLLKREYALTGSWQEPVLERIQYAQSDR